MTYLVKRTHGKAGWRDYLAGWDIIWGPVWGAHRAAIEFTTSAAAREALTTANVIMAPVPWRVPHLGSSRLEIVSDD